MKNLALSEIPLENFGVVEMNQTDMIEVEGGGFWKQLGEALILVGIIICILL